MANQTDEQEAETESLELLASEEDALELLREKGSPRLQEQLEHGVVTPIELANAVGKRPQMIYNYIRAGRIAAHRNDETQKLVINLEDAQGFVRQVLNKDKGKAAQVNQQLQSAATQMTK
jgi:hypothetical protein